MINLRLKLSTLMAFLLVSFLPTGFAADSSAVDGGNYVEGVHYVRLPKPIKTGSARQIEVAEYFSYGCPHCYQFEPNVTAWHARMPEDVTFIRTPAVWGEVYRHYAQSYYAAEELKMLHKIHAPLFNAIQKQGLPLNDLNGMAKFFEQFGVDQQDFRKVYNSFGVNSSVQKADARGRAYRSSGVPAVIINGKYRVEGGMAGSNAEMIKVADFLIARERAALIAER